VPERGFMYRRYTNRHYLYLLPLTNHRLTSAFPISGTELSAFADTAESTKAPRPLDREASASDACPVSRVCGATDKRRPSTPGLIVRPGPARPFSDHPTRQPEKKNTATARYTVVIGHRLERIDVTGRKQNVG